MVIDYKPFPCLVTFINKAKPRINPRLFSVSHIGELVITSVYRNITKNTWALIAQEHAGIGTNNLKIVTHLRWFVAKSWRNGTPKYRKPKVKHVKRVVIPLDNSTYQDSEHVKLKKMSIQEVLDECSPKR